MAETQYFANYTVFVSLAHIHVKDIGRYFIGSCLSPFLYTGQMFACFHSDVVLPQLSDFLKMIRRIGEITSLHSFSILLGILSGPAALCGFRLFSNLFMPVSVMLMFGIEAWGLGHLPGVYFVKTEEN